MRRGSSPEFPKKKMEAGAASLYRGRKEGRKCHHIPRDHFPHLFKFSGDDADAVFKKDEGTPVWETEAATPFAVRILGIVVSNRTFQPRTLKDRGEPQIECRKILLVPPFSAEKETHLVSCRFLLLSLFFPPHVFFAALLLLLSGGKLP